MPGSTSELVVFFSVRNHFSCGVLSLPNVLVSDSVRLHFAERNSSMKMKILSIFGFLSASLSAQSQVPIFKVTPQQSSVRFPVKILSRSRGRLQEMGCHSNIHLD